MVKVFGEDGFAAAEARGFDDGGIPVGKLPAILGGEGRVHQRDGDFLNRKSLPASDKRHSLFVQKGIAPRGSRRLGVEFLKDLNG